MDKRYLAYVRRTRTLAKKKLARAEAQYELLAPRMSRFGRDLLFFDVRDALDTLDACQEVLPE